MAPEVCDACGRAVHAAGGLVNFWQFGGDRADGLSLELADGSEWLLCYDCIEQLPEDRDATAEDVEALRE